MITYRLLQFAGFYGYAMAGLLTIGTLLKNHLNVEIIGADDRSGLLLAGLVGFFSCLILVLNERNKKPGI